ncbi:MAG: polysaccharide biosynthesis/export family protein [Acidobacteriota bacterium]
MTIILLTLWLAWGQASAAAPARAPQAPGAPGTTLNDEYVVGPQDVIALTIFNDESQSRPALLIDTDGTIDCPYIGRVKVAGLTPRQIEDRLRQALGVHQDAQGVTRGFLVNPNINVAVKEFRSQRVSVNGAVRNPGEVELKGDPTLTRALTEAGYPIPESGSYIVITHSSTDVLPGGGVIPVRPEDQIRVSREDIDNGRASRIRLRPGDSIRVPTADKFYIFGEVKNTGMWVLSGDLNVLQALAMAGGLTDRANKNNIRIQRVVDGRKLEIKAKESTAVMAGDTIVVKRRLF